MVEKIAKYLKHKYGSWGWVGQRVHDAVGINQILPLDFIVGCDYGEETDYFFNKELFSLEKLGYPRSYWSNQDLDKSFKGELGDKFVQFLTTSSACLNVLCYRSIGRLEKVQKDYPNKLRLFAVPEYLKTYFDNKIFFREKISQLNLKVIPGKTINLDVSLFKQLVKKLGIPFVIQFPYGSSGMNTYMINNQSRYKKLCSKNFNQQVNALKFLDGYCLNVNGIVITQNHNIKVYSSFPSIQLTGLEECSSSPTIFCGNDYTAAKELDEVIIDKVIFITKTIGRWMGENGYKGIFGIDMIVNNNEVYPIEINPRFQNSTSLLSVLEIINRKPFCLFLLHILEFLKEKDPYLKSCFDKFPYQRLMQKLQGAQIILHNSSTKTVVNGELLPGIYEYDNNTLTFKRQGISLMDCKDLNEILITCGVPFKGKIIEPSAPICKIQTKNRVLCSDFKNLNKTMSKIVKQVYMKLTLNKYRDELDKSNNKYKSGLNNMW